MQLRATSPLGYSAYQQTREQIEREFGTGKVPQIFRLLESQPVLLTHLWGQFQVLVLYGDLPRVLKEMVGLIVAAANHCDHMRSVLLHSLMQQQAQQETLSAIVQGDYGAAEVSHATRAILRFAAVAIAHRPVNGRLPQDGVLPQDKEQTLHDQTTQALDDTGLEESEQLELIATIALFEQLCTVANLLQLEAVSSEQWAVNSEQ